MESADRTTVLSCFSHLVSHPPPIYHRPGITTSHFPRTDPDPATTLWHDYTPLARILFSFIDQEAAVVVEGRCCRFGLVSMYRWWSADRTTVLSRFSHLMSHPPPIPHRPGIATLHYPRITPTTTASWLTIPFGCGRQLVNRPAELYPCTDLCSIYTLELESSLGYTLYTPNYTRVDGLLQWRNFVIYIPIYPISSFSPPHLYPTTSGRETKLGEERSC
ncbi:hypothetical protein K438DRAFT_672317 [Mycena galopus ATCC 62051]|nr:hypothetical protein K438DRAFT_672317 [Mycena galopus ATCC 62051]